MKRIAVGFIVVLTLTIIVFCSDDLDPNPPHIIKPIEYTIGK